MYRQSHTPINYDEYEKVERNIIINNKKKMNHEEVFVKWCSDGQTPIMTHKRKECLLTLQTHYYYGLETGGAI